MLLKLMGTDHFDQGAINNFNISRIGRERTGYNRAVKIVTGSKEERNEFTKNAKNLKNADDLWKKVYVRKDEHPVYLAERTRLRKKMEELKRNPDNRNKEITIKDGKLMVDSEVADENIFFA